jgi:hypothetical protein
VRFMRRVESGRKRDQGRSEKLIHRAMGWAYEFHGMHEQAIAEFLETARLQNASTDRLSAFRQSFDLGGMRGYWRKWLELQHDRIVRGRMNPFYLAQVYAFVGTIL